MVNDNRVALITGGGKGVGAGIARIFCEAGMHVCMGYNSNSELAEHNLRRITDKGGKAFIFKADVSDRIQLRCMVDKTVELYGGIDVLVNCAAIQPNMYISEYDAEMFDKIWQINIGGYLRATQECLPYLKKSECPRIINISSVHGKRPAVFDAGYSMTKGAIRMFTREAALEFAKYDITVNCIDLGACRIEGKTGNFPFKLHHDNGTNDNPGHPLGRIAFPEDAGHLALFLADPDAKNINGAGIRLDGGAMLT